MNEEECMQYFKYLSRVCLFNTTHLKQHFTIIFVIYNKELDDQMVSDDQKLEVCSSNSHLDTLGGCCL